MNIYVTALTRERYRRTSIFGRKRRIVELAAIAMICGDKEFSAFNLNFKPNTYDHQIDWVRSLKNVGQEEWYLYSDIVLGVKNFLSDIGDGNDAIITYGAPDTLSAIREIINLAVLVDYYRYESVAQRQVDAASWIPDSAFGALSNFDIFIPPHESHPYGLDQKLEMFSSHYTFPVHHQHSKTDLVKQCQQMRQNDLVTGLIMQRYMEEVARGWASSVEVLPDEHTAAIHRDLISATERREIADGLVTEPMKQMLSEMDDDRVKELESMIMTQAASSVEVFLDGRVAGVEYSDESLKSRDDFM